MWKQFPEVDSKSMRHEDEGTEIGMDCPVWSAPAADSFRSRGPRPKPRRQGIGRALRLVTVVLMIVIPLALWLSNMVASSSASTSLAHY
jgi:hypothetical protein